jgi:hypothetical protein
MGFVIVQINLSKYSGSLRIKGFFILSETRNDANR